jgi:DnaJ-class molecular chaperone
MSKFVESKIIIYHNCGGDGISELRKSGYNEASSKCSSCEGTGRVVETTIKEWKPFKKLKENLDERI